MSNRLLQSHYADYFGNLNLFLNFIESKEIIKVFIDSCGSCILDIEKECQTAINTNGREMPDWGNTYQEEVRNIISLLHYLLRQEGNWDIKFMMLYSRMSNYQDIVDTFNNRVVKILINHIEGHLTRTGIPMQKDSITYSIQNENGQIIIANDNANTTINAYNNSIDLQQLTTLINAVQDSAKSFSNEEKVAIQEELDFIRQEIQKKEPKKSIINDIFAKLKAFSEPLEFAANVTALFQFISSYLG